LALVVGRANNISARTKIVLPCLREDTAGTP